MNENEELINDIINTFIELNEYFPDNLVAIGGIAVYFHSLKNINENKSLLSLEFTHDGDFYISQLDYIDLKDIEAVTVNKRLSKSQMIKKGIEFDIYVERTSKLIIDFQEIVSKSIILNNVRIASLEHLLMLKTVAAIDRSDSEKGEKDNRDIIKIIYLINNLDIEEIKKHLTEDILLKITEVVNSNKYYNQITNNNYLNSKQIKEKTLENFNFIKNALLDNKLNNYKIK